MNTPSIKGTNVTLTGEVRDYALKKFASACEAFVLDNPTSIGSIELEYAIARDGEKHRAEFTMQVNSDLYRAEAWGETLHGAVDVAANKLAKELRSRKGKKIKKERTFWRDIKKFARGM